MLIARVVRNFVWIAGAVFLAGSGAVCGKTVSECERLSDNAFEKGAMILGADAERVVVGKGRLQFYSAPNYSCKMLGTFVVEGDAVVAYTVFGHFTAVAYLNGKEGGPVNGWVESKRLRPNGLGIAPR
ncbi:hypothetical protein [Burkholderia ubonensis]|uniref:hypothetical protein n=1 Tax=Burkholderia ubonensis TaxID=101571 RepID=UPI0012FC1846|nr:hypothetical protein [Burkholderia ubonensis]